MPSWCCKIDLSVPRSPCSTISVFAVAVLALENVAELEMHEVFARAVVDEVARKVSVFDGAPDGRLERMLVERFRIAALELDESLLERHDAAQARDGVGYVDGVLRVIDVRLAFFPINQGEALERLVGNDEGEPTVFLEQVAHVLEYGRKPFKRLHIVDGDAHDARLLVQRAVIREVRWEKAAQGDGE